MSRKYYYAVRCGHPAIEEVHGEACTVLAWAGRKMFMGTFCSLGHALQSARLRHPGCAICQQCAALQQ
ncbi:hypothetical protein [Pantoea agglomerans]|uniref:hypothetical protein n=1 Tax=Enterobacter agglomerans TaxID=549 RepID=UPI000DAD9CB2|nr:hypothetical protein [Pantoea agglomerans]RAH27308.1 hypothetical protein DOT37_21040 [Pantoea agglomerans]TGX89235.1 hypothetical protein E5821_20230 [Pantoea agglomerans]